MKLMNIGNNELVLTVMTPADRSVGIFPYPVMMVFPAEWVTKSGPERVELIAAFTDLVDTFAGGFSDAWFSDQCSDCHQYLVEDKCVNATCLRNAPEEDEELPDGVDKRCIYITARLKESKQYVSLLKYDGKGNFCIRKVNELDWLWVPESELEDFCL
jgi:hypothetical protein